MSHTQTPHAPPPAAPAANPGVAPAPQPGVPPQPSRFATPRTPPGAPSPAQRRFEGSVDAVAALADQLDALRVRIAPMLEADDLAALSGAVTELKAMVPAPSGLTPPPDAPPPA